MKKIVLFVFVIMFCMNMVVYAEKPRKEIYIDPISSDGDGSFEKPFKTLEEARNEVRKIKKAGYPDGGITVYLRGGNYNLNDTFELTEEDSGTDDSPVVWKAYENEDVNITGGARLKVGNFQVAQNDQIDESVKGRIYSCNLKQMGIDGYDKLHITGHAQHYLLLFGLITDGDTVDFGTAIRLNATGRATNLNGGVLNLQTYGLDGTYPFTGEAYAKYPHMANILEDNPLDPKYNVISNNTYENVGNTIEVNPLTSAGSTITESEMRSMNTIE